MKARIPTTKKLSNKQVSAIKEYLDADSEKRSRETTDKNLVLFAWVLWHDFGMGPERLPKILNQFYERAIEFAGNETWYDQAEEALKKHIGWRNQND